MADAFGAILKFLGALLNGIYQVVPSYGVAIILLTIVVRLVLFPLAVKQIRSMTAMQRIQPRLKELQQKHKGDRQKLNEEMMKLYREHGVNPFGGCFPMLLQLPVFIALYAVIRSAVPWDAALAEPLKAEIAVTRNTICRPVGEFDTSPSAPALATIRCDTDGKTQEFTVGQVTEHKTTNVREGFPAYVTKCASPSSQTDATTRDKVITGIQCTSPLGTGHLPKDGKLFKALVEDHATFLGMHLACSPTQASSKKAIRACTEAEGAGGGSSIVVYYSLVLLMAGTTYYQQRQMLAKQPKSPQAQQMQMMMKIMPVFMGFLSLSFPAALSLYWVIGNFWMIGQQHFILKNQPGPDGGVQAEERKGGKPKAGAPKSSGKRPQGRPGKQRRR
ncbi:MAG: YidC/Oxa1 family membrane protein insertase [Actinomycetota bacterium]